MWDTLGTELGNALGHSWDMAGQFVCIFDRDSFLVENFNQPIKYAQDNNIKVSYYNSTF